VGHKGPIIIALALSFLPKIAQSKFRADVCYDEYISVHGVDAEHSVCSVLSGTCLGNSNDQLSYSLL